MVHKKSRAQKIEEKRIARMKELGLFEYAPKPQELEVKLESPDVDDDYVDISYMSLPHCSV